MKLPFRPVAVPRGSHQWVCNTCSRRAFTSTSPNEADAPKSPEATTTTPQRTSPRRQSAAAFAQIRNLQQQNSQDGQRAPQSREPSSTGGNPTRMGSGRYPARPGPNVGGLRYQPHKVTPPQASQRPTQQPQFRIIRSPVDGPAPGSGAQRGGPDRAERGARLARPAGTRPGAVRRGKPRRNLLDVEDEVTETNEAGPEEALDVTEEEIAASLKKSVQKRTGVLAASHGESDNTYMRRRHAAITARVEEHRKDEEKFRDLALLRLRKDKLTFGGKGPLKTTRGSHALQARAWPYMLALRRSRNRKVEQIYSRRSAKWASLARNWVSGKSAPYSPVQAKANSKENQRERLRTVVQNYINASPTYAGQDRTILLEKFDRVAIAARL